MTVDTFKELKALVDKEKSHRDLWPSIARLLADLRQQFASNKDFSGALLDHDIDIDPHDRAAYIKMASWTEDVWQDALASSKRRSPRYLLEQVLGWDAEYYAVEDTGASWVETQDSVMPQPVIQNEPSAASEPPEGDSEPGEISELVLQPSSEKIKGRTYNKTACRAIGGVRVRATHNFFGHDGPGIVRVLHHMHGKKEARKAINKFMDDIASGKYGSETPVQRRGYNSKDKSISLAMILNFEGSELRKAVISKTAGICRIHIKSKVSEIEAFFNNINALWDVYGTEPLTVAMIAKVIAPFDSVNRQPDLSAFSNVTPLRPAKTQMQPIGEEDIVIYGEKLWPSSVHDYLDVWHCFHFWEDLDRKLAISMPRPAERGDAYIKLSAWAKGIDPVLGSVLEKAGRAMSHRPEQSEETRAAMRMIGQGRG